MMRVRVRFTKTGKVRFISHRDLARVWERTLRRAELPVAYSGGFSPRPRLHFGLALSVGHESCAEYLDIDLAVEPGELDDAALAALPARFSSLLPTGVACTAVAPLAAGDTVSLQEAVTACSWRLELTGGTPAEAEAAVADLLGAGGLVIARERKGKTYADDIRPYVRSLALRGDEPAAADGGCGTDSGCGAAAPVVLHAELGTQPRALRPAELIAALGAPWAERRVRRLAQWIDHDGRRREPLAAPDPVASWARTAGCAT